MPSDKFAIRLVLAVFAVGFLLSLAGMIALALLHRGQVQAVVGAFTFSAGTLAGVIAKTTTQEGAQQVEVTNTPTNAVPVTPGD